MTWIQTASGRAMYPLLPREADISIEDIAHALAHTCRFRGHCTVYWSVAHHCCTASTLCEESLGTDPGAAPLHCLLHDAAEAYLPDVPSPLKHLVQIGGEAFDVVEDRLLAVIYQALRVPPPTAEEQEIVRQIDAIMLATEKRDLMAPEPQPWVELPPPSSTFDLRKLARHTIGATAWEFRERFHRLWVRG